LIAPHIILGVGIVVAGVVVGSGGVIIVVGTAVPGDGWGSEGLGVTEGVAGEGTIPGGETVPVTGGGEGTGMLTAGRGENGAAAVRGMDVVGRAVGIIPGVVGAGVERVGEEVVAGVRPGEPVPATGCCGPEMAIVPGDAVCPDPGTGGDPVAVISGVAGRGVDTVSPAVPAGVIRGAEHPAPRRSRSKRPVRSTIFIRTTLVPSGT
jgi:hypothetical protein